MKQDKRIYVVPAVRVVELRHRQTLLAGSQLENYRDGGKIDDWSEEE